MFVDPLSVMLLGVSASTFFIAFYLISVAKGKRAFAELAVPTFFLGIFDFVSGFYMSFFWPLPGAYNMLFGDPMLLLGLILLSGSYALYRNISPNPVSLLGFLLGIYLFAETYSINAFSLEPHKDMLIVLSFYLVSAIAAVLSPLVYTNPKKSGKVAYYLLAVLVIIAAILAMAIGEISIIGHLQTPP
ncbi:MAG: DUF981 family protein [Candidatus Micrarchaeaceae archaeon]